MPVIQHGRRAPPVLPPGAEACLWAVLGAVDVDEGICMAVADPVFGLEPVHLLQVLPACHLVQKLHPVANRVPVLGLYRREI